MYLDRQINLYIFAVFFFFFVGSNVFFWFIFINGFGLFEDLDMGENEHEIMDPISERIVDNVDTIVQEGFLFYWDWEKYWTLEEVYYEKNNVKELNEFEDDSLKEKSFIFENEWNNIYFMMPDNNNYINSLNLRYNLKFKKDIYGLKCRVKNFDKKLENIFKC